MKLDFGVFWAQKVTPHLRDFWNLSFTSALSKSVVHGALSFGRPGHTWQWEAFQQARQRIDPMRTFANAYTARVLGD